MPKAFRTVTTPIRTSQALSNVKYEIRGQLSARAHELERQGYEIVSLNIGNPGLFGYRTPETMRLPMIENLGQAEPYSHQMELLAALRLCNNVPGQWAVQTALGGFQSMHSLVRPGGRLYQSRQAVIDCVNQSAYLSMTRPMGAMYAFIKLPDFVSEKIDDETFALELLEEKHVLIAPGSSFNTPYSNYFRITTLPDPDVLQNVFGRVDEVLEQYA